jgi:hypothetical protein
MDYAKKTCKDLVVLCKHLGITGYKKKKSELIGLLKQKSQAHKQIHAYAPTTQTQEHAHLQKSHTQNAFITKQEERIQRLRALLACIRVNHKEQILQVATLKEAHVYCVIHGISAQRYGPLLERFIQNKFTYNKNKADDCLGDCTKNNANIEIKVSLGGARHTKFNFVQLRPSHQCDLYLLTAYHLSFENVESEGELYIFRVSKEDMKHLIVLHGSYAHGTMKEHGKITLDSLCNGQEYALRPSIHDACWKSLLSYRVSEDDLY